MSGCLTDEAIVALAEGTASTDARSDALAHVETCPTCGMLVAQASRLASRERVLMDRYLVHGELGSGGMGTVVLAFDRRLDRDVALKIVDVPDDARDADRLLREGRALAMLNHPNVVTVFDVHRTGDSVLVAMELVRGQTLRAWLGQARAPAQILRAFAAAGRGLMAAHRAGLVHRDFKPANVMIDDADNVTVVDFGLATLAGDRPAGPGDAPATQGSRSGMVTAPDSTRRVVGTPLYMAPEQHAGLANAASDQYQFCLALLEALSGSWPFATRDREALADAKRREALRPPALAKVPRGVRRVLRRGLRADPTDRWPDLSTVVAALQPRRASRWVWAPLVMTAAALTATTALTAPPASTPGDPCAGVAQAMAQTWDDARAEAMASAFAASGHTAAAHITERTRSALDAYVGQWRQTHASVCAEADAPPPHRDAQLNCLVRARRRMDALVDALLTLPRAKLGGAPRAVEGLPSVDACRRDPSARTTPSADAWTAARIAQLEASLDQADAFVLASTFRDADDLARAVAGDARQLGHDRLLVDALALRTRSLRALDHPDTTRIGEQAYRSARLLGDQTTAWKIASDVSTAYRRLGEFDRAWAWLDDNESLVLGLGDPAEEAAYLSAVGAHHFEQRQTDEALAATLEAVEILEADDPNSRQHAVAVRRLAGVLRVLGRTEEAAALLEQVRTIIVETMGPEDPELRFVFFQRGVLLLAMERFEEAVVPLQRALELIVDAQTDASIAAVEGRGALAMAYSHAGRLDDAKRTLTDALRAAEGLEVSSRVGLLLHRDLAEIATAQGDQPAAAAHLHTSLTRGAAMESGPQRDALLADLTARARTVADALGDDPAAARLREAIASASPAATP